MSLVQWSNVGCVTHIDYFSTLVSLGLLPFVIIGTLVAIYGVPWPCFSSTAQVSDSSRCSHLLVSVAFTDCDLRCWQERAANRLRMIRLSVFSLFVLYPRLSSSALSLFQCQRVEGVNYLIAVHCSLFFVALMLECCLTQDFSIICYSSQCAAWFFSARSPVAMLCRWNSYVWVAVLFVLLYPVGIPVLFFLAMIRSAPRSFAAAACSTVLLGQERFPIAESALLARLPVRAVHEQSLGTRFASFFHPN